MAGFCCSNKQLQKLSGEDHSEPPRDLPDSTELKVQVKFRCTARASSFQKQGEGAPPPSPVGGLPFSWQMTGTKEAGRHIQVPLKPLLGLHSVSPAHVPVSKARPVAKAQHSGGRKYILPTAGGASEYLPNNDASTRLRNTSQIHPLPYTAIAPTLVQVSRMDGCPHSHPTSLLASCGLSNLLSTQEPA